MSKLKHPIHEAERYLQNARQILTDKAGKDGNYYQDDKYVRMAGNTAWNGVLIALDGVLNVRKNLKSRQRPDIKDYQAAISKKDPNMSKPFHEAYKAIHLHLGYDGTTNYKIVQEGMNSAKFIIDWASSNYVEPVQSPQVSSGTSFFSTLRSLFS